MTNTRIQIRRSSTAGKIPSTSDIQTGELGLNMTDKTLYSSNGTVIFLLGSTSLNMVTAHAIYGGI